MALWQIDAFEYRSQADAKTNVTIYQATDDATLKDMNTTASSDQETMKTP